MFGRRLVKEIRGRVTYSSGNQKKNPLEGIGIRLFQAETVKAERLQYEDISVIREKQVLSAKTNGQGEFFFYVNDGDYSLCADLDTLPAGTGVRQTQQQIRRGENKFIEFTVRDIASIELNERDTPVYFGESINLKPVLKDNEGNVLSAKVRYSSDSDEVSRDTDELRHTPKVLKDNRVNISVTAGKIIRKLPVDIVLPALCSVERINLAGRMGIIDEHKKIQYLINSLFEKRRLPDEYKSRIPVKSGTGAVEEIRRYIEREDADTGIRQEGIQRLDLSVPELDRTYLSPGGYFNIHYTISGENAVAARYRDPRYVPSYIREVGAAFDHVKAVTCGLRGFREPVLEEGRKAYDIYVYDLKGIYGVTFASKVYNAENSNIRTAASRICIDNSYSKDKGFDKSREDCMRVTAAHEFFHAVQYAYNIEADLWWKEATATWNEDEIYTGVNDYVRYLNVYFSAPQKSLDESSYSGVVFAKFLSENYGGYNIIKKTWEVHSTGNDTSVNAIDRAIGESYDEMNIGTLFNRFTAFNFNPSQYYKEGREWKVMPLIQQTYSSYPVSLNSDRLNHMASSYHLFKADQAMKGKTLRIHIEGTSKVRWGFKLQRRRRNDYKTYIMEVETGGGFNRAEIVLNNFSENYEEVCLIPANLEKDRDSLQYSYFAGIETKDTI